MNWRTILEAYYSYRPCFICGKAGYCDHREPDVAFAEIYWLENYGPATPRKPAHSETTVSIQKQISA